MSALAPIKVEDKRSTLSYRENQKREEEHGGEAKLYWHLVSHMTTD